MKAIFPFILIGGIIILVIGGIMYSMYAEKRRVHLQEAADEMGLTFS